ncbi:MAG: hypothetical protein LBV43_04285 [Prevotella sp.]|jgi:hypothetical protein|nr:hypothetical protein [Prevotella sp.]
MNYGKLLPLFIVIISGLNLPAQVTIGSSDPPHLGAVLELKSNNKGFLGPRVQLESTTSPNPVSNPATGLLVFNTGDSGEEDKKVEKDKFYFWSGSEWVEFVYEEVLEAEINDWLEKLGIPRSAVYHLDGTDIIDNRDSANPVMGMFDVMKDAGLGVRRWLRFKETDNETDGKVRLSIQSGQYYYLYFMKGVYSITFSYQFIPSTYAYPNGTTPQPSCTASSYFVDFPLERNGISTDRARIHNVAYHKPGNEAHHGGAISYVLKIENDNTFWEMRLGAGQSGSNCNYRSNLAIPGFSLVNQSTFILVSRIGD